MSSEQHNAFDDLEAELSALTPVAPTDSLKQNIAMELDAGRPVPTRRRRYWQSLLLAAAACVAGVMMLWQFNSGPVQQPAITNSQPVHPPAFSLDAVVDSKPTSLAAYRQAIFESPEAFEVMLDRDADVVLPLSEPISLASLD